MRVINASNVNSALSQATMMMRAEPEMWRDISPRGNATMEWTESVATVYARPWQRVVFSPERDANPFFHLMEALWMLNGRDDAEWLSQFSSKIGQYAEANGRFHGAYGLRWVSHFVRGSHSMDQLHILARMLRNDPTSRRAVLTMWDPIADLAQDKKDLPCNTHVYFKLRDHKLNMLVSCRSNDLILGCYGANAVHFSILQEYLAARIDRSLQSGTYTHLSDSWHYYVDNPFAKKVMAGEVSLQAQHQRNYYTPGGAASQVRVISLVNGDINAWDSELEVFMSEGWEAPELYDDIFFRNVAYPMRSAWVNYKRGDLTTASYLANQIAAPDWRIACTEWLDRRIQKLGDGLARDALKEAPGA